MIRCRVNWGARSYPKTGSPLQIWPLNHPNHVCFEADKQTDINRWRATCWRWRDSVNPVHSSVWLCFLFPQYRSSVHWRVHIPFIHTWGQFRVCSQPDEPVSGLWEETRIPGENLCTHEENKGAKPGIRLRSGDSSDHSIALEWL